MALAPGSVTSYNVAPGQSQADLDLRRKYAYALMQQGMDGSPVQHWAQGAARMGQALMGGYELHRADEEDRTDKALSRSIMGKLSANRDEGDATAPPLAAAPTTSPPVAGPVTAPEPAPAALGNAAPPATPGPRKAFLTALAGSESPGYNVQYGGGTFDSYADHPRAPVPITTGPMAGKNSTAAGRYQFIAPTWDAQKRELGLPDFSPDSQDAAAWNLANKTYTQKTGGNLETDLADPANAQKIAGALSGVWPSLPGGSQPNKMSASFPQRLAAALQASGGGGGPGAPVAPGGAAPAPTNAVPTQALALNADARPDGAASPGIQVAQSGAQPTPQSMRGGLTPERRMQLITELGRTRAGAAMAQHLFVKDLDREAARTRPLTDPNERAKFGIQSTDTNPYQVDATGKISPVNPQPFAVNVNQQQESEFRKKAGSLQAERFNDLAAEGRGAQQMQSDIAMMRDLGEKIKTGKLAEVKAVIGPYADALGIKIDGLNEIQAYEAVLNRVAPSMRVKGTGAQSDFELKNFFKQFPTLGNTPEGNVIIDRTLQGFVQNKIAAAEIGADALSGTITAKEAEKKLRELPDPMAEWRAYNKNQKAATVPPPAASAAAPSQATVTPSAADIDAEIKRREEQRKKLK